MLRPYSELLPILTHILHSTRLALTLPLSGEVRMRLGNCKIIFDLFCIPLGFH